MSALDNTPAKYNPFLLDDILTVAPRNYAGKLAKTLLERALGLHYLAKEYDKLEESSNPQEFIKSCFDVLKIDYKLTHGSLEQIPESGATIVVANHPFGAVEGMIMVDMLLQRRPDVKIMANGFLKRIPELKETFLGVNPYGHNAATRQNMAPLREALKWLKQGGLIFMFPAGDVSSIQLRDMAIVDQAWDASVARLATKTGASVVPMHIAGRNSTGFYLASLLHPVLKTLLLPRELIKKSGRTVELRIGKQVDAKRLESFSSYNEMADYLRLRSYLLAQNDKPSLNSSMVDEEHDTPIITPIDDELLAAEIRMLPEKQLLLDAGVMHVYHADAKQIPWVMQEIGRLREISFRAVGEGTGQEVDIDLYDSFYQHLFIWDAEAKKVIGGYRLGLVDKIIEKYGLTGLYSYSLFKYKKALFKQLNPALELGRSFVRPEYQKNFTPLMLLWKGISIFVSRHPQYAKLFGPVSISNDYSSVSQQMLVKFLKANLFDSSLGRYVKPRNPYRHKRDFKLKDKPIDSDLSLEQLSGMIAEIEPDAKGVPVLIRQYLKMGGKMLGFNIDEDFGHCVDGLILVDLRHTDHRLLTKYMGVVGAELFMHYHSATDSSVAVSKAS